MFGIFDYVKIIGGAVIGAALVFYPARWIGQSEGKQMVLAKMQSDRIKILQDGKQVDTEALGADDEALCGLLGGCASGSSD